MTVVDRQGNVPDDLAVKAPCTVATTAAITLSGLQTIDGVAVVENMRVLVKDQADKTQNGIYQASSGAWLRPNDAGGNVSFIQGTQVFISQGAVNAGQAFVVECTDDPIVIGTSLLVFALVSTLATAAQTATSATALAIGTGAKVFATQAGKSFVANQWLLTYSFADPSKAMLCQIVSYTGTTLTTNSVASGGAGTVSDWVIVLTNSAASAGFMPPVGAGNVSGPGSSTAGHLATFADATGKVLADGGAAGALANLAALTAQYLASSAIAFGVVMLNGTIAESHAAGAATYAVKTFAGTDPSATDPAYFIFRDVTPGAGDYVVRKVTAALSVVIPSTSTVGFANATAGRLWFIALDNAGTVELGVINCRLGVTSPSLYPLAGWGIISTSALAGANSALVPYSTTARASLAFSVIGYATYEDGLTIAGTWDVAPSRIQLFGPGVPLPNAQIQLQQNSDGALNTGTAAIPVDDTIPQNGEGTGFMTQAITPRSKANVLEIEHRGSYAASSAGGVPIVLALVQDAVPDALTATISTTTEQADPTILTILHSMLAQTTISTTFKAKVGNNPGGTITFNGYASARKLGGVMNSIMRVKEIMG